MRTYRLAAFSLVIILITALIVTPVLSASSSSQVLTPLSLTTQGGSTSGSLPTLGLLEQSNTDDSPSAYITFSTPSAIYSGYITYQLPVEILPNKISSILLQVNFKGPDPSSQVWTWFVLDWSSQLWIKIGDTIGTQPNIWNNVTFRLRNFSSYISPNREIRIHLQSNNSNSDAKLDYQAIHITYTPFVSTVTQSVSTFAPTKGVYVFPTTVTPSPTLTPSITPSPTNTPTRTPTKTAISAITDTPPAGSYEPFEDSMANWIIETDVNGTGSTVTQSNAQKHSGNYSAISFTTNSGAKAQVRDVISSNWSGVPTIDPGAFIWQRAYVYVPSTTANALTGNEYLDLGGLYASSDSSGFYLRLKAAAALYATGPGTTGQTEFNLNGTFPLDQWVEVELGLWSRNTGDLDRAGCFIVNGKFYGWFTNGKSGTDYNRAAMGIVTTNSADDLTVYVDNWHIYKTTTTPTGTDNRPTGTMYTKDFTTQSGENVGYHYTTWENGYTLNPIYGLSPSGRIQSSIETSKMPDLSDGWSQIVMDWASGNTPPWPPDSNSKFFAPMIAFRKSVGLEENLEVVPVYRSGTGTVDLVFESWTLGPIEYATWQLPMDGSGHRIPGRGDIIRVRWQEVSATEIRVRVDYYDASAGVWTLDAMDHTRGVN